MYRINDWLFPIVLLLTWLCALLSADDVTLRVLIPFMLGSFDWINYFLG